MVLVQLVFRGWAMSRSWFEFDDFAFISILLNEPLSLGLLLEGYGGHMMPGGLLLSWVYAHAAPLDFTYQAVTLMVMQALASLGCLALLRSLFGPRWGILAPLGVYLFAAISLPAFLWWAAGVNQLPLQIALFWGLLLHVSYLRRPRLGALLGTVAVMALGLAFYEKTLLVYGAIAIVTLGYFAAGSLTDRIGHVWRAYRPALLAHVATGAVYLGLYVRFALDPGNAKVNDAPLLELSQNLVLKSFLPGVLGGPLDWRPLTGPFQVVDPAQLTVVVAAVAVGALALHVDRTRTRSRRAWLLPAWFLVADLALIASARAAVLGGVVALEMRYLTETAAAAALGVALATMPLRGAVETVERKTSSPLLDRHEWAAVATVVVTALGAVSGYRYATVWGDSSESREYFRTVASELADIDGTIPAVSVSVPQYLMWGYRYPENTTSHVLRMYDDRFDYPSVAVDELYLVDDHGALVPAVIPPTRRSVPLWKGCGYRLGRGMSVPLDGPVTGGGWWVRMAYVASDDTDITIGVGDLTHRATLPKGLHNVYFTAEGDFNRIRFSGVDAGTTVCTNDVVLGTPEPLGTQDSP